MTAGDLLCDDAWMTCPTVDENFKLWQQVSMRLQCQLRNWIAEEYFMDARRFEDRQRAYPMLVYQAARVWKTELTHQFNDYPRHTQTVIIAIRTEESALGQIALNVGEIPFGSRG